MHATVVALTLLNGELTQSLHKPTRLAPICATFRIMELLYSNKTLGTLISLHSPKWLTEEPSNLRRYFHALAFRCIRHQSFLLVHRRGEPKHKNVSDVTSDSFKHEPLL